MFSYFFNFLRTWYDGIYVEFEKEEVFQSILLKNSYRKFCGKVKYTGNCSNPWTLEEGFLTSILFYRKIHFNSYKKKKAHQRNWCFSFLVLLEWCYCKF